MIPTFPYYLSSSSSSPSPMPIDLNIEDHNHDLVFSPIHQPSSSNSSLSNPTLFNPSQNHTGSSYWEPKNLQADHEEAGKIIVSSGSWDDPAEEKCERKKALMKLKVWKKRSERENQNHQGEDTDSKWMSSKTRMMRKIMVSDQKGSDIPPAGTCEQKFEDENQKQQPLLSPQGTDNNSSSNSSSTHSSSDNYHDNNTNNNSNIIVRVCVDCHTTKTPLWRSGPRGPKSLCNACGIRQRKARRAMAAATANGLNLAAKTSLAKGNYKFQGKEKKSKMECESHESLKKKRKLDDQAKAAYRGRVKKFNGFEDFRLSLSKKLAPSQVFPQEEKEAAILLMALSYNGLVHG